MKRLYALSTTSAFALAFGTTAAFADLTAPAVWEEWKSYLGDVGYTVTGTESVSGGTLTITDLRLSMTYAEDGDDMDIALLMDSLTFTETDEGGVRMAMPAKSTIKVSGVPDAGGPLDVTLDYTQSGFDLLMTGTIDDITSTYSADTFGLSLAGLTVRGDEIGRDMVSVAITTADIAGTSRMLKGDTRSYSQSITTGEVGYQVFANNPDDNSTVDVKGSLASTSFSGTGVLPTVADPDDMTRMLTAGFNVDGGFSFGSGNTTFNFTSPDGSGNLTSASDNGAIAVTMSGAGLGYEVTQTGVAINALVSQMPIPISMNMDALTFNFAMPLLKSDAEQDFGFKFGLEGLTVSDILWGMVDPTAQLPRDPATFIVDLAGKAKLLFDFLGPDAADAMAKFDGAPGELNSLDINELKLSIAGADLDGSGAFTFDNSDLESFDGLPKPTGAVDLSLAGGNGLLDKLVGMGLVQDQAAMGARMMMGLFAVPGDAPDTLNSKIEINDQGHILANGQRIQ